MRTPNPTTSGNNYIFQGDSLSINSGGALLGKVGNNTANSTASATITVNHLRLNGGWMNQADVNNDHSTLVVTGNDIILQVEAVPEPSIMAMVGAGLGVLLTVNRRRKL